MYEKEVYFSLFSLSLLIAAVTLGISIKNKFHKQFLSELMTIVIISEVSYLLTRYPALVREKDFSTMKKYLAINTIQLCGSLFCDSCTLLSTLAISLKILDGIMTKSRYFNKLYIRVGFRCLVTIVPFGITLMFILLELNGDLLRNDRACNIISCVLKDKLNIPILIIFCILVLIVFTIISISLCYLSFSKRKMSMEAVSNDTMIKAVSTIQCKLMIFPIISVVFWIWRLVYQIIFTIFLDQAKVPQAILWIYSIVNSLRGAIYSIMYIFSLEDLRKKFRNLLCFGFYKQDSNLTNEELMMKVKNTLNENDKLVDISVDRS